jgi:hypothetical protein
MPPSTTCDIYRAGHTPPAAPDVAGVKCFLAPKGQSTLTTDVGGTGSGYSHVLYVDQAVDVRDGSGALAQGTNPDSVYVPDKNGTPFIVILVRRYARGTANDHLQCLVRRLTPTWPTANL